MTGRDRDRRLLAADVVLPDGPDLNQELARAGYAWWFRRYSTIPPLAALEGEAREARAGLWADRRPVPPWEWRRHDNGEEAGSPLHRQAPMLGSPAGAPGLLGGPGSATAESPVRAIDRRRLHFP